MKNYNESILEVTRYFNRDISWLSFNQCVLEESLDPLLPIVEKIKFIAIHASNLDEFYRVRVSHLETLDKIGDFNEEENSSYSDILAAVREEASHQTNYLRSILATTIIPELEKNNVILYQNHEQVLKEHLEFIYEYFNAQVASFLQPIWLSKENTPFLEDRQVYLVWQVSLHDNQEKLILLNVPTQHLPRFVSLPQVNDQHYVIYLDDIVRIGGEKFLENYIVKGIYSIKLNRDAGLSLDEYTGEIADQMKLSLEQRAFGAPSRFQYDVSMPKELVSSFTELFKIEHEELTPTGRYQQMSDFFGFPIPVNSSLSGLPKWKPLKHEELTSYKNYFKALDDKDFLLHFPYQSYDHVLIFFNQAVLDPYVTEIMATFYRVAFDSHIVNALISASKNGKKVKAFVEVKARFDEANNLLWAEKMEKAGIEIFYSLPDIKVHAKTALITRIKDGITKTYGFYGTGNFNERTAGVYSDIGLFTASPVMNEELKDVFLYLYTGRQPAPFRHLLVSQFNIIDEFKKLISDEITIARSGREGRIMIKLNNLEDSEMIDALYEASNAGVKIELIVRSICRLKPGVPGLSENISFTRVVGRYLEHSRIFIFNNDGVPKVFLGSSDWMERNLRSRVEVVFPVYNEACRQEIFSFIQIQLAHYRKSTRIGHHLNPTSIEPVLEYGYDAQEDFYQLIKNNFQK
ncbi:polyphosphate kinase 1 [Pedobacter cryoconitis]|uniref:Polyphosphate kinase n=1 Tax=Pedobacter cryoconitis TaxID=188932 RepID=A0A7X0MME6_9SPHI|nr:polyphosphate kinase 1 [Pedobacter cryoconitis]MBB6502895.1 polyphosphate kinase [Pedobacter cryoconitis]